MKPHPSTLAALTAFVLGAGTVLAQTDKYWTGTGTWGTDDFWSLTSGGTYDQPWVAGDNAIFEGTPGTVTLGAAITANDIDFTVAGSNYLIDGNSLNMAGGSITVSSKNRKHTITSAITGSPAVNIINGTGYEGLTFAPTSGTVALGTCTVPYDDPVGGDKAGIRFGGSTTGNTVSEVTYQGGDKYGAIYVQDTGEWTFGNVLVGIVYVQGGDMIANGEIDTKYAGLQLQSGTLHYNNEGAVKGGAFKFQGGSLDNTSGAAITTSLYNPASSWEGNWTFIGSNGANSDLNLGTGTVTLTGTRTVTVQNAATTLTIDGVVTDSTSVYGLTKAGDGTLKLTNANTYNGATTVSAGTLSLGDGTNNSNLDDDVILEIDGTGTLDLNFTAGNVDTVLALTFDDALQATGTWGRTGHPTADHTTSKITGDGLINNLGGAAPAGTNYWDGSLVGGTGNGASNGGSGIWSTSNANWDAGLGSRVAWPNTTADKAIFRAAAGTVDLESDITLGEILIDGVDNYVIGSNPETQSLHFGGAAFIKVDQVKAFIRAGITGSPNLLIYGNNSDPLYLYPDSASMTLGEVTLGGVPNNPLLELGGSVGGNSISKLVSANNWSFLDKKGTSTWTIGDVTAGTIRLFSGTLAINGTFNKTYLGLQFTGGTLAGDGTINTAVTVPAAGNLAPGAPAGTLSIAGSLDISALAGGTGTLNYELNALAGTSDRIAVTGSATIGTLGFTDFVFTDLGGLENGTYTLITTTTGITGAIDGGDSSGSIGSGGTGTLQIDGTGKNLELVVSGLGASTPYQTWAGGAVFSADDNGDGVANGLAFLLGAANPSENAIGRLPTVTESGGALILNFNCLPIAARGTATLKVAHSTNLAAWTATVDQVPDANDPVPDNNVTFVVGAGPAGPPALNSVTATIGSAAAGGGGKLFGRLEATE
ncbi:MAG: beta strand repeat-containing protein [Luteolibacter sp.]